MNDLKTVLIIILNNLVDPYVALSSSTQISTYKSGGPLCFNDASTYMNGTCIKTVYYKQNSVDDPNIYLPNTGVLTFPSPLHNKRCLPDSPVKYLYNVPKSFCESAIDDVSRNYLNIQF